MIKLIDNTEWPDDDYHAQKAFEMGCTRAHAKSRLLLWNYYGGAVPLQVNQDVAKSGRTSACRPNLQEIPGSPSHAASQALERGEDPYMAAVLQLLKMAYSRLEVKKPNGEQ